jgi:archaellum biogenesis ATPase FlaH
MESKEAYETFRRFGNEADFSPLGRLCFGLIRGYREHDSSVQRVPGEVVIERAARQLPNPKHSAALAEYVRGFPADVSGPNLVADIVANRRKAVGDKLSLALANGGDERDISKLIADYSSTDVLAAKEGRSHEIIDVFATDDLESKDAAKDKLIKLWPKQLTEYCDGGASKGHHILIVARPEKGKTAFAINMCAGFLAQNLSVLYIGNEEPAVDIRTRFRMRLLRKSKAEIRENPKDAAKQLEEKMKGRLKIAALSPGSFPEITALVEQERPDVLVLDQLRNLSVKSESRTNQLETCATEARNLAKKYGLLVLSITQAGDSASGKIYLALNDIDGSKTGIPAAVDLMIGVGGDDHMTNNGLLGVSLPKNKLSGNHATFSVSFDPITGLIS